MAKGNKKGFVSKNWLAMPFQVFLNTTGKSATVDTINLSDFRNAMTSIHNKMVSVQKIREEQMKI